MIKIERFLTCFPQRCVMKEMTRKKAKDINGLRYKITDFKAEPSMAYARLIVIATWTARPPDPRCPVVRIWRRSPPTLPSQPRRHPRRGFWYSAQFRHGIRLFVTRIWGRGSGPRPVCRALCQWLSGARCEINLCYDSTLSRGRSAESEEPDEGS